jgi:hypothetical protein
MQTQKIALLAGNRKFPLLVARYARQAGFYVVALAIKGQSSFFLKNYVDKIYWLSLAEFGRLFDILQKEGIRKILMAGQINPRQLFNKRLMRCPQVEELLKTMANRKADTVFGAIANRFAEKGIALLDSTMFIKECLPNKGVLSRKQPDSAQWQDIYFGLSTAKEIGRLDIGQSVAVKDKTVVAVEALEGTDALIRRAGRIAGKGLTITKVSKPNQDMRFDVPVVGPGTIKSMLKAGAVSLAIEAGKTVFIDKEVAINLADKRGICVVAV